MLLLPVLALPGSDFMGVGWCNRSDRLAFLILVGAPLVALPSAYALRVGEPEAPLRGGVTMDGTF